LTVIAGETTDFALAFYKAINEGCDNIVYSPFSLSLALSMALAGAETSTETAMLEGLQFTLPEEEVHPAFNALLLEIEEAQQEAHGKDKDKLISKRISLIHWHFTMAQAFTMLTSTNILRMPGFQLTTGSKMKRKKRLKTSSHRALSIL